jgi:hypothetical protein
MMASAILNMVESEAALAFVRRLLMSSQISLVNEVNLALIAWMRLHQYREMTLDVVKGHGRAGCCEAALAYPADPRLRFYNGSSSNNRETGLPVSV